MFDFLEHETFFGFCALAGSGLFAIQFLISVFGGDAHDHSIDDGSSDCDAGHFNWLSKQAMTGFLMMFGWIGLTCRKEFGCDLGWTILVALIGGLLSFFITGLLFRLAKKLRSPGMVFRLEDAIGKTAVVYQRIPPHGTGKVSLSLHDLTYEIDAVSSEELPSFTQVKILKKADEKTVFVVPSK